MSAPFVEQLFKSESRLNFILITSVTQILYGF
ncbi:hypothetical protein X474_20510 [Dethiosulfatarculus sandiegensis]|uniref:Uncharacterized protein n=1 Tax=Dethiosulfatarculus sandiegensis TaxID=1429043 RepID=A0A0D2J9D0_9BACT|nr:hypothetical protein X474_20510 [Dethiosulfatarculus sandiegensis]